MLRWIGLSALVLLVGCRPHPVRVKIPASLQAPAPPTFHVLFTTTQGDFTVEVHREWAPQGADRFYNLARSGYYEGTRFFRVVPKFVVQWGLSADPEVTKAWRLTGIVDDVVRQSNLRGFVTFASGGPGTNSRTTQVYINLADNARLDRLAFAPFGKVVAGMDVVDKLYSGYGEGAPRGKGPNQMRLRDEGEPYLAKEFPQLDKILKTRVIRPQRLLR